MGCRCAECASVHAEFISHFGRWPEMSHVDAMDLKETRIKNEASWNRMVGRMVEERRR
jgi:hypothetical protein